jgi:hypothetical protein
MRRAHGEDEDELGERDRRESHRLGRAGVHLAADQVRRRRRQPRPRRVRADRRQPVGKEVDGEDLHDRHRRAESGEHGDGEQHDLAGVGGEEEGKKGPEVFSDPPPLSDGRDDGGEVVVACQIGTALASRTERASLRSVGLFTNLFLLWGIFFEIVFAAAVIYLPPLQPLFHTAPLGPVELAILAPFPLIVWGVDELRRAYRHGAARVSTPPK